jgi:hypothetical protein
MWSESVDISEIFVSTMDAGEISGHHHVSSLINYLTSWSGTLLEKVIVPGVVKKFPALYCF